MRMQNRSKLKDVIVPWSLVQCLEQRATDKGSRITSQEHVTQLQARSPTQVCENQVGNHIKPQ